MSRIPKIYGFCPAGCKWETVHKDDFDAAKSTVRLLENEADHTIHLTDKTINLMETNPYFDTPQHFKIYDGTVSTDGGQSPNTKARGIKIFIVLNVDGEEKTKEFTWDDRVAYEHEIDFIIKSIEVDEHHFLFKTSLDTLDFVYRSSVSAIPTFLGVDVYIKNTGYPYTDGETTTERIDGCENTRVYSVGYGNGLDEPKVKDELLLRDISTDETYKIYVEDGKLKMEVTE